MATAVQELPLRARFELQRQAEGQAVPLDEDLEAVADGELARVILVRSTEEYREQARRLPREAAAAARPALAIDIGSAYGHTTEILARELGSNEAVVGIDVGWKFVDESRKRCPQLRFERLDVLEDQQFVVQLVDGCRATRRSGSSSSSDTSTASGVSSDRGRPAASASPDDAAPVTQPVRHPPKRSRKEKAAAATAPPPAGVAEVFACDACSKAYSSVDYRSGAAGAKGALAQHVRDMHSSSTSAPATEAAQADGPGAKKKVTSYVCTVCSVSKGLDQFSKNQRNGRKSEIQCKTCNAALRAARREAAMRQRGLLPPGPAPSQPQSQSDPQLTQRQQQSVPEPEPEPEPQVAPEPESEPETEPQVLPESQPQQCAAKTLTEQDAGSATAVPSDHIWVFVDIGGVRELAALVRLLPLVTSQLGASVVVVKSKRLCQTAEEHLASDALDEVPEAAGVDNGHNATPSTTKPCLELTTFWERVQAAEAREGILGRSKERRGGAPIGARYPLKLPCRYTEDGVEICRFHNYSQAGCIRGAQGRCPLDHSVCHWCGEAGHIALACEAEVAADVQDQPEEVVVRSAPLLEAPAPFLYCLGGRLRGRTLVSCERINLANCKPARAEADLPNSEVSSEAMPESSIQPTAADCGEWEPVRALSEHRGSHGAAAVGTSGLLAAVGGGGMRANLSSTEVIDTRAAEEDPAATWQALPPMKTPRHAFALAAMPAGIGRETMLYATGGWMYGSCCTGSVERLVEGSNSWEVCAPLSTPRRLHGAAALANKLYVFGGSPGNGAVDAKVKTDSVECYLPEADRWEARAPLPRPMNVGAAAVGKFIYVLPYGDEPMWRYDPGKDSYECMGPLPLKNFHCFAVTAGSATGGEGAMPTELYVLGGTSDGVHTNASWQYTPPIAANSDTTDSSTFESLGTWTQLPAMQVARRRTAAAVVWAR